MTSSAPVKMPYKCFLCPKKSATLTENAAKCEGCNSYYHRSCAKKAKPNGDNVFRACCGSGDSTQSNDVDSDDAEELDILDASARALYKLLSKKIDDNSDSIVGSIDNIKSKITTIEERLVTLEDNALFVSEDIIAELQDRNSREKNIMVYKLRDSVNAEATDKQRVIDLLSKCSAAPSFNVNDMVVSRLGNKFVDGSIRPLKVALPSKEDVHWVFHNKKMLCREGCIAISADLTRQQRAHQARVINELKNRKDKGEEGIFIKYIRGVPTITVDKSAKVNPASSTTQA